MTWFSERSGIASTGVSQAAHAPRAASARLAPMTRARLRIEKVMIASIMGLIVARACRATNQWSGASPGIWPGLASIASSQPSQQRKTTWPETTTRAGVPIEPSGLFVTGQSFWRSASAAILGRELAETRRCRGSAGLGRTGERSGCSDAFASARTEVAGREAGVQPRLGVEQKGTGERDALARLEAPHDRVIVAAARAQDDLDAVEHPGHALDEDDLARAGVDDRRSGTVSTWPAGCTRSRGA